MILSLYWIRTCDFLLPEHQGYQPESLLNNGRS